MSAMPSSKSWFSRMLALSLAVTPAAAHAQSLPKGYASDELPSTPPPATTPAAPTAGTPAPTMTPTVSNTANVTATAQISTSADEYADTDPSALTDFREPLQGYGTWVTDDTYGTIWVPDTAVVGADFAPYQSGGYWTLTDDGEWLWVSTYDWGYVPFHYGRWLWIGSRGWSWIPGRTYAPAWVAWRTSDYGYIGWAPLPPTYYWGFGGSAVYFSTVPAAAYVFCPSTYVFHTSVHTYVVKDKETVKKVAAHSRNYKPASPTASAADHKAPDSAGASKSKGAPGAITRPKGPSMKEAGVPDSVVPKKRGAHDTRAQMFSKKSTTASAKALVKTQRSAAARSSFGSASSTPASRAGSGPSPAGSSIAAAGGSVRRSGPGATGGRGGSFSASVPAGSREASSRGGSQAAPRGSSQPVLRTPSGRGSAPSAAPAARPSTPSARAPSASAPRASAPAARAPAARASTPSASPSRSSSSPSRSSSSPSRSSSSPSRGGRR